MHKNSVINKLVKKKMKENLYNILITEFHPKVREVIFSLLKAPEIMNYFVKNKIFSVIPDTLRTSFKDTSLQWCCNTFTKFTLNYADLNWEHSIVIVQPQYQKSINRKS